MLHMYVILQQFASDARDRLRSDDGATAVEYGIMVALIAVVIITAVALIGTRLNIAFQNVADRLPAK